MKRRICAMAAVALLTLTLTVQLAGARAVLSEATLMFEGSTAVCSGYAEGKKTDYITVDMALWHGSMKLYAWPASGYGSVEVNGTLPVSKGQTYRLTVDATVAGKPLTQAVTIGVC